MGGAEKTLRAGVIGLGVGAHQARSLALHPHCELAWICDLDEGRLSSLGEELPEARRTVDAGEVLRDPSVGMVCVATWDESHRDLAVEALERGKHVYVEKPMCLTSEEARDIRRALSANPGLRLSSNLVLRTCPLFDHVREAAQSGEMGAVYHLEADYRWGRFERLASGWRAEAPFYSIIHGAAVHAVDLLLWISGRRPATVQALGNRVAAVGTPQRHNDFAVMLLSFEDGASAKVAAHGGATHPHFHSLQVFGTKKSFIHEKACSVWFDSSDLEVPPRPEPGAYPAKQERGRAVTSFVDSLVYRDRPPLVSEEDVFAAMSVCLAAEKAVSTGSPLEIDYI